MTDAAQKLFEEAMKLSPEERTRVAQQLLESTTVANSDCDVEDAEELEALSMKASASLQRSILFGDDDELLRPSASLGSRSSFEGMGRLEERIG